MDGSLVWFDVHRAMYIISIVKQTRCTNVSNYNINQKNEGTLDDQGRDGGTNFILRIKEQETRLTLQEHDDDDIYTRS